MRPPRANIDPRRVVGHARGRATQDGGAHHVVGPGLDCTPAKPRPRLRLRGESSRADRHYPATTLSAPHLVRCFISGCKQMYREPHRPRTDEWQRCLWRRDAPGTHTSQKFEPAGEATQMYHEPTRGETAMDLHPPQPAWGVGGAEKAAQGRWRRGLGEKRRGGEGGMAANMASPRTVSCRGGRPGSIDEAPHELVSSKNKIGRKRKTWR